MMANRAHRRMSERMMSLNAPRQRALEPTFMMVVTMLRYIHMEITANELYFLLRWDTTNPHMARIFYMGSRLCYRGIYFADC